MHRDWLIVLLFLFLSIIAYTASYETNLLSVIPEYIKRLISPITTGILP
ncbi:MAG: hypothetical protein RQ952_01655 [Thermoproteota archaeon]|nr:hypothetical protein [Thermoproteota archaeon]